jgi:flagellar biosynthetic protein FliQ
MDEQEILDLAREAIFLSIQISAPILLVGLAVGLAIGLLQALTQVQEITLVFVPKIVAIFLAMFLLLPSMMKTLTVFMESLADKMIGLG